MLPNARSNRPPRLRLLRQLRVRKRPLLPISIGCTRTDELCTEPGCARCFRYGSSPVAACVAHRLLHATVGPAFQRLQLPHPSHLEPSPVSSLNWAGRPVPLVLRLMNILIQFAQSLKFGRRENKNFDCRNRKT